MPYCDAYQMTSASVASSVGLCGLQEVGLRAFLRRALAAAILLRALGMMVLFTTILSTSVAWAEVKRISSVQKDLSSTSKIYLKPGLVSVLEFPQNIIEVRLGQAGFIKAKVSQVSPKELTLFASSPRAKISNLIVRAERRVYVFDIVISEYLHQDFIKVSGAYGAPSASTKRAEVRLASPEGVASAKGTAQTNPISIVISPLPQKTPEAVRTNTTRIEL